ncbi:NAD(P)/FAD-dependent oxidoreductase (plasmid) [Burkholderia humptydooensis]|uniref:FAD-dependent disulfide oxidoreductase n=3 Tax=pseudomallei group TaxID=111527 RepID=V9NID3_BURTH|nr:MULTISPECIES: NAD(P)/FAD-dependent oxidoreductase [Burkholderia]AGO89458.1 FAD-dependent disulfide oxidoreductase [Burkholderia humptydooensis]AJY38104.1 oxidoreductase [Burkholderia sp. 2002721687]ALX44677.1 thioredoxin reductase [Burkholderia humptydooensis]EIP84611.1 pyridine nucleotide-disulfide oxidoreductase, class II [Burkholderia humptydooensis MSMB43]QPS41937.1 NAD(P)/FAD-dependent oxidoreductase [Burkholderia humptydooensis]
MDTERSTTHFDVIVIGGSHAGQSAALQIARARRRVLVIDAGTRRNRFAAHSHGVIGQDGRSPDAIAAEGKAQLLAYPNAQWRADTVARAEPAGTGYALHCASGQRYDARHVVLAFGVVDELPDLAGVRERWGQSVFHCPYCHGYELDQGRIGVLGSGPLSYLSAMLMPEWGKTVFLTDGSFEPDDEQREALARRGVEIVRERIARIVDRATVELADGRRFVFDGLFTMNRTRLSSPVAEQLGCVIEDGPLGPYVRTDDAMETSVPGVFACGDITHRGGTVALAIGNGALAGLAAHRKLVFA